MKMTMWNENKQISSNKLPLNNDGHDAIITLGTLARNRWELLGGKYSNEPLSCYNQRDYWRQK
jgi:hypothetical protein